MSVTVPPGIEEATHLDPEVLHHVFPNGLSFAFKAEQQQNKAESRIEIEFSLPLRLIDNSVSPTTLTSTEYYS